MGNISKFKDTWSAYRNAVTDAMTARDKALERLEGYRGERAEKERQEAYKRFSEAVETARVKARDGFTDLIQNMRSKADAVGEVMEAPSEEQLRLLQLIALKSSISQKEADSAARALEGNDACISALQELCNTRGGVRVSVMGKSRQGKACDALREFEDGAKMLLQWEGGSRFDLLTERNRQGTMGMVESERVPLGAALVADIDAGRMSSDAFVRKICGNVATPEGAGLLD